MSQKTKIEVIKPHAADDETCQTFGLRDEDHTLGNSLRHIIMKNPDVEFCGYSFTHPSENKINLRIQTTGPPAIDVLKKGLEDLIDLCAHAMKTFENVMEDYKQTNGVSMMEMEVMEY